MNIFRPLTKFEVSNLTDDWVFMSLTDFVDCVQSGGIIDYDGSGKLIFVDTQGKLYLKESTYIYPSDIRPILQDIQTVLQCYTNHDGADEIRKRYQEDEFIPFAVFWYNK